MFIHTTRILLLELINLFVLYPGTCFLTSALIGQSCMTFKVCASNLLKYKSTFFKTLLLVWKADAWLKQNMSCWSVNSFDVVLKKLHSRIERINRPTRHVLLHTTTDDRATEVSLWNPVVPVGSVAWQTLCHYYIWRFSLWVQVFWDGGVDSQTLSDLNN